MSVKRKILTILVSVALTSLVGCKSDHTSLEGTNPPDRAGGSDGGGGIVKNSSKEEVKIAIGKALLTLNNENSWRLVYDGIKNNKDLTNDVSSEARSVISEIFTPADPVVKKRRAELKQEMDNILAIVSEVQKKYDAEDAKGENADDELLDQHLSEWTELLQEHSKVSDQWHDLLEVLNLSFTSYAFDLKINYQETGSCPAEGKAHADASVSEYSKEAEVCFSLENLQRIPFDSLDKHIVGLWLHELTHIAGVKDEAVADAVQAAGLEAYDGLAAGEKSGLTWILWMDLAGASNVSGFAATALEDYMSYIHATSEETKAYLEPYHKDKMKLARKYLFSGPIYMGQFLQLFGDDAAPTGPILFNPEVEDKRQAILTEAKIIKDELVKFSEMSDEELLTEEMVEAIRVQNKKIAEVRENFEAIRHYY